MEDEQPNDPRKRGTDQDRRAMRLDALDAAIRIAQVGATPQSILTHAAMFSDFLDGRLVPLKDTTAIMPGWEIVEK